jgi:electron transfer flavoprotein beta subunit
VIEREQPDVVFAGTLSSDHAFAQTGMNIAAVLGWPHAAVVNHLELNPGDTKATVHRELEGGLEEKMTIDLPAVLAIQLGINEPRYASLRGIKQAKRKEIEVLSHVDIGLADDDVGVAGSLSRVRRMVMPEKGQAEIIEGTSAEKAARLTEIIKELQGVA